MKVNRWRVYLKPFTDRGTYATNWIDVTEDVDFGSLGSIAQQLDNTEYDIGVYRNASLTLTLGNDSGKYSDVDVLDSIFRYKRTDTLCKITWEIEQDGPWCGDAILGDAYLSTETTVFIGLLSDESLAMDLDKLQVPFQILGRESVFDRAPVPASVANGDLLSAVLFKCLNQSVITNVLNVSALNITLGQDATADDVTKLVGSTAKDAVDVILKATNSVFYIVGDDLHIAPRTPGGSVVKTFHGQGSQTAPEDIVNILGIRTGLARTFNYLSWSNTTALAQDATSIAKYGVRAKSFACDIITDVTKQTTLLTALVSEFRTPKLEFDLIAALSFDTIAMNLLDRVAVDYPIVYQPDSAPLPICGIAICGSAITPRGLWAWSLSTDRNFKILGRKIDMKKGLVTFRMREI